MVRISWPISRKKREAPPIPEPEPDTRPVEMLQPGDPTERAALIEACVAVLDQIRETDPVVWRRLGRDLEKAAVTVIVPDGQPFDGQEHLLVESVPTDDPDLDGTIAATEVVGVTYRGRTLRLPHVHVYERRTP
ncbi:hypothetical protein [Frankia sp. CiP3]|uniref:hypothetical protein n=1 Tax=Frankia sp. CiP3 TaxID=2880971 RepID=UPI001EF63A29|nr:hypothetical protein [Frankia sp. CiP3]